MADKGFVDVGDELVVRIEGYPVGKAIVDSVHKSYVLVSLQHNRSMKYKLPLNFIQERDIDGVGHNSP